MQSGRAATLEVAVLQTAPTLGAIDENLRQLEAAITEVATVDLVVACELAVSGFGVRAEQLPAGMGRDDSRLRHLAQLGPAVSLGFIEAVALGLPFNSSILFGDRDTVTVQRKLHPVSYAPWNEHELFAPGAGLELATVHGASIATLICNDAWHPVMPWLAVHAGVEVLLIPAASLGQGEDHAVAQDWDAILTHTARILQCYVVFANRAGSEEALSFWGGSRIIGPTGSTLVRAGSGTEIIQAQLDLGALRQLRRDIPLLDEVRRDLVEDILATQRSGRTDV